MWSAEREVKKIRVFSERIYYGIYLLLLSHVRCNEKEEQERMNNETPIAESEKQKMALLGDGAELGCRYTYKRESWTKQYITR